MTISRKGIIIALALVTASPGVYAATAPTKTEKSTVEAAFCPAVFEKQSYRAGNLDHYAMLIPGKDGWIFRTENDFRADWENSQKTINYLLELQEAFKRKNADLVIIMPPVRGLVHADRLLEKDASKHNVSDLNAAWARYESSIQKLQSQGINIIGLSQQETKNIPFFYKRNHHWSPHGAKIVAKKVSQAVMQLPTYSKIEKTKFVTHQKESKTYDSSFETAFKKLCNTTIPPETVEVYETAPEKASLSSAILGTAKNPQVVLVGTSNSFQGASTANFEGFLKEFLSADVLNLSFMGAGIDTSIMSFLNSDQFKNKEPKIVIWEVPGYYYFDELDEKVFTQLIPAAYGDCASSVLLQRDFSLKNEEVVLYDAEDSSAKIFQDDRTLYAHLKFPKPITNNVAVKFTYTDGLTKKVQFQRAERYPHDGDFYTLFPVKNNSSLSKIKIVPPKGIDQVSAQICTLPDTSKITSQ